MLCYVTFYVTLRYVMLCYAMLCFVLFCYVENIFPFDKLDFKTSCVFLGGDKLRTTIPRLSKL